MENQNIYFSDRTLYYTEIEKLLKKLENVENVDKIVISISYKEKKKNVESEYNEVFENISNALEYIKELKKIDKIKIDFYTGNSFIYLSYDDYYTYGWKLEYKKENNVAKAICYILEDFFKPNSIKNIIFSNITRLWIMYCGLIAGFSISANNNDTELKRNIQLLFIILFFCLLGISIYKIKRRCIPYRNNKFWETHKIDIVQNIIFYILGIITPYIISWVTCFIKGITLK